MSEALVYNSSIHIYKFFFQNSRLTEIIFDIGFSNKHCNFSRVCLRRARPSRWCQNPWQGLKCDNQEFPENIGNSLAGDSYIIQRPNLFSKARYALTCAKYVRLKISLLSVHFILYELFKRIKVTKRVDLIFPWSQMYAISQRPMVSSHHR